MENIIISLIIFLSIILLFYTIILFFRSFYVQRFCYNVNEQAFRSVMAYLNSIAIEEYTLENHDYHVKLLDMWDSISKRLDDYKILFMIWVPLKEDRWFTHEQIDFLNQIYKT